MVDGAPLSSRILLALHEKWWEDREAGREPRLAEYLGLWPGYEVEVAREFLALLGGGPSTAVEDGTAAEGRETVGEPAPGRRLGRFTLREELGRGGQGVVYEAFDERLQRAVALKVLHGARDPGAAAFLRFQREAAIASRLEHPSICPVLDAGREGPLSWIAMRLVPGEPLSRRIAAHRAAGGRSPLADRGETALVVRFIAEAARAAHAAHEAGVLHRDLKPGNLMVARRGAAPERTLRPAAPAGLLEPLEYPVILDFGLAREDSAAGGTLTATGNVFGTPAYMAPELLEPSPGRAVDRRADVWALGVSLFEALTLRRPFEAPTQEGVLLAVRGQQAPLLRRCDPRCSRDLEAVVQTALEKDPARRYQTALAFAEDLMASLEFRPISVRRVTAAGRLVRWAQRRPAHALAAALLVLGVPTILGLSAYILATSSKVRASEEAERRRSVEAHLEAGYLALEDPEAGPALRHFAAALAADPGNVEARLGRLLAFRYAGREAEAAREFDAAGAPSGIPVALRRVGAGILRSVGRLADANALLAALPEPTEALDLFVAGMSRLADRSADGVAASRDALGFLMAALHRVEAARPTFHFQAAIAAAHAGEPGLARALATSILQLWPGSAAAHMVCGYVHQALAEYEEARIRYERAADLDPRAWRPHIGLGDLALLRDDPAAALLAFEAASDLASEDGAALSGRAECLLRLGRAAEARVLLEAAIARNPRSASLHSTLGRVEADEGRLDHALRHYRRALELRPHFPSVRNNLGNVLFRLGRLDEAEAEYRAALAGYLRDDPISVPAHLALAMLLGTGGDAAGALHHFCEADRLQPNQGPTLYNLGLAHFQLGQYEPAIAALRRSGELDPGHRLTWLALARAHADSGDEAAALGVAESAMQRDLATSGLCYLAGGWLSNAGRLEEAEAAYLQATRVDPSNAEAWCNLGQARKRLGRFEEALEALSKGHAIGSERGGWTYPSAVWIAACEELIAAEGLSRCEPAPGDPEPSIREWDWAAEVAEIHGRWTDAVRCLERAMAASDEWSPDGVESLRVRAARAALRAAGGAEAAAWRARAREHLIQDLGAARKALAAGSARPATLGRSFAGLPTDPAFAPVRDEPALAALPEAERSGWRRLWEDVDDLLDRCGF